MRGLGESGDDGQAIPGGRHPRLEGGPPVNADSNVPAGQIKRTHLAALPKGSEANLAGARITVVAERSCHQSEASDLALSRSLSNSIVAWDSTRSAANSY